MSPIIKDYIIKQIKSSNGFLKKLHDKSELVSSGYMSQETYDLIYKKEA